MIKLDKGQNTKHTWKRYILPGFDSDILPYSV